MEKTIGKEITGYIVSPKTGEIFNDVYKGDRIVRRESVDFLMAQEPKTSISAEFIKLHIKSADLLSRVPLKESSYRICLRLLQHIQYDSGLLKNEDGNLLSSVDIEKLCADMSERTVKYGVTDLCKEDIFAKFQRQNKKAVYFPIADFSHSLLWHWSGFNVSDPTISLIASIGGIA